MNINILKETTEQVDEFEKKEWIMVDQEHYGKELDWWNPKKFIITANENDEGVVHIKTLIVSHTQRGQGIGTALLTETERIAKVNGAHKLYLTTGKGWPAEKLYQKFGMQKTGELPNHYVNRDFVEYSKFIQIEN